MWIVKRGGGKQAVISLLSKRVTCISDHLLSELGHMDIITPDVRKLPYGSSKFGLTGMQDE